MFLSRQTIRALGILTPCHDRFVLLGLTAGLGPCGYDVQADFGNDDQHEVIREMTMPANGKIYLIAAQERFNMPNNVVGLVCDKSTWARGHGVVVQNTIIEPGWQGFLTLELSNQGQEEVTILRGMPIAQVIFSFLDQPTDLPYQGKYQNQLPGPQKAK